MNTKKVINKYLIVIAAIFLIFLGGRIIYDYNYKEEMLQQHLLKLSTNLHKKFKYSQEQLIQKYSMIAQQYINSKKVYDLFKEDNHQGLYKLLKKDYNDFKYIDKDLFVMHFIDKDNITVLRMHKPQSFDDDLSLKRPMVNYANSSLKTQAAFETGKNGIVYRVTTPFIHEKDHIGVLEFGINLEYFMRSLEKDHNVFGALMVKTDQLKVLVAKKEYKTLGDYSLISKDASFSKLLDQIDIEKTQQIVYHEDRVFLVCSLDLEDYNGKTVSKVLATKDITPITEQNDMWFYLMNSSSFIVYILVIVIMWTVLIRFSNEIRSKIFTIKRLNKRSEYLKTKANTDSLTKIYNKEYFNKTLKLFKHENRSGVLMFFDIDHFKKVNDTFGHISGDKILKNMTERISGKLRDDDVFARWGGEEFVILLSNTTLGHAYHKADQIRKDIQNSEFHENIKVTISIGLAEIKDDEPIESLVQRADELLYKAKNHGRNRVMF